MEEEIIIGEQSGIDLIETMNEWCWKVDQGIVQADRGFTYREFYDLWNDHIEEADYGLHPIFHFLGIKSVGQRAFYRTQYDYDVIGYEQALLDTNHSDLLKYLRQTKRLNSSIPLSLFDTHALIRGGTRSGKSTYMRHLHYRIRERMPHATHIILDPHGPFAKQVYKSKQTTSKNTIYLDVRFKKGFTFKLNIFDIPDREENTLNFASENVPGVLREILASNGISDIQLSILQRCVNYVYSKEKPSLDLFLNLLNKDPKTILDAIAFDPFFSEDKFKNSTTREALRSRFDLIFSNRVLNKIVSGDSTINLAKEINKGGKTILFDLGGMPEEVSMPTFAKMVLATVKNMVSSRELIEKPKPVFLWIDECQNFVTDTYETLISQMSKFGIRLILAHQYASQIDHTKSREALDIQVLLKIGRGIKVKDIGEMIVPKKAVTTANDTKLLNLKPYHWVLNNGAKASIIKAPNRLLSGKYDLKEADRQRVDQAILDKYYVKIDAKKPKTKQKTPPTFTTDLYLGDET